MFQTLKQTIFGIVDAFQTNPLLFSSIFGAGLLLIWFKYWLIHRAIRRSLKQNYAGWYTNARQSTRRHSTGIGHNEVLVMKPVRVVPIALFCLVFFGGGAIFVAQTELGNPNPSWKVWVTIVSGLAFSLLSLWMIVFSFTRIILDEETIERRALFRRPLTLSLSDLVTVKPISKTIAGGVYLEFKNEQRFRVVPRISGYRQLLEMLAKRDPKLALMLRLLGPKIRTHLDA